MPEIRIKNIDGKIKFLIANNRVFLQSGSINIFPCSRRGQYGIEGVAKYYDPEARLNTERTNRIHTAINGFTDSFIDSYRPGNTSETGTLVFALAGYHIEVKNFDPVNIASALGESVDKIYAHLSLHGGISLNVKDYFTEILYRQSDADNAKNKNYLDVSYTAQDSSNENITHTDNFFVGISFTADETAQDAGVSPRFLELFNFNTENNAWELAQTSLLPKIGHGETEDSIKIDGSVTVNNSILAKNLTINDLNGKVISPTIEAVRLEATGDTELAKLSAGETELKNLSVSENVSVTGQANLSSATIRDKGQIPALELAQLTDDTYQLRFKFGTELEIKDERPQATK